MTRPGFYKMVKLYLALNPTNHKPDGVGFYCYAFVTKLLAMEFDVERTFPKPSSPLQSLYFTSELAKGL